MSQLFSPGLTVSRNATVRKVRELSVPGEVLVKVGDRVGAGDIIARAEQAGEVLVLRVAEKLGIEPVEVERGMKVAVGQELKVGATVCEHAGLFGLFRSRFEAPAAGVVDFITPRTGHVGLRLPPKQLSLRAYVDGTVVAAAPGKSATIEARGAVVQGIFGVGGERTGRIKALPLDPSEELQERHLAGDLAGAVVVGGTRPSGAALRHAAAAGAVGLVVGSIDDQALSDYLGYDLGIALTGDEPVAMSVIVTEGFGVIPMAERTYRLLQSFDGRRASINGATQVRAGAIRPEIIIAHEEASSGAAAQAAGLEVGAAIRLIRVPYFGLRAAIVELPHQAQRIETGAFARVLIARLEDGRTVTVPRANVELLPGV